MGLIGHIGHIGHIGLIGHSLNSLNSLNSLSSLRNSEFGENDDWVLGVFPTLKVFGSAFYKKDSKLSSVMVVLPKDERKTH